ncbi:MAG: helix-turn-helix domain-containing protein [Luteolibacter sp.]
MLADRHHSITAIALDRGFARGTYFSGVFRRHFHCSPRAYRDALHASSSASEREHRAAAKGRDPSGGLRPMPDGSPAGS